jgi:hypothetical protein
MPARPISKGDSSFWQFGWLGPRLQRVAHGEAVGMPRIVARLRPNWVTGAPLVAQGKPHKRQDEWQVNAGRPFDALTLAHGRPGAGRVKLRLSRGFPRRTRLRRHPLNP